MTEPFQHSAPGKVASTTGWFRRNCHIKPYVWRLLISYIVVAVFVTYLADYASCETTIKGLVMLFTITVMIALAAFFKAFSKTK